jgi:hypothetical protein
MVEFASASSEAALGVDAAREAASKARHALHGTTAALAIVSVSSGYEDLDAIPGALARELGDVPIVGGTAAGAVIGSGTVIARGLNVVLIGGDDLAVATGSARIESRELVELMPVAKKIGLGEFACLAFAPGLFVDGEALVAVLRKGAGVRAALAGGLIGDALAFDRARTFADGELHRDRIVLAGLFTKRRIGVAARHGWRTAGPAHVVTRSEGTLLRALDGRPALDVWLEDVRAAGGTPPRGEGLLIYLVNNYVLGITVPGVPSRGDAPEFIIRAPFQLKSNGVVRMSASMAEGETVRLMNASPQELLDASKAATSYAMASAGGNVTGGLVLACTSRIAALGGQFPSEVKSIQAGLGAPIGGLCVYGEIARTRSDADAFFNTTTVVVAFPA